MLKQLSAGHQVFFVSVCDGISGLVAAFAFGICSETKDATHQPTLRILVTLPLAVPQIASSNHQQLYTSSAPE